MLPLCSTYLHVVGLEIDWNEIVILFAGAGHEWDGVAFFPHTAPDGGPLDDPTARLWLRELEARIDAELMRAACSTNGDGGSKSRRRGCNGRPAQHRRRDNGPSLRQSQPRARQRPPRAHTRSPGLNGETRVAASPHTGPILRSAKLGFRLSSRGQCLVLPQRCRRVSLRDRIAWRLESLGWKRSGNRLAGADVTLALCVISA